METVLRFCATLKGTKYHQKSGFFCAHLLKMLTQNQTQNIQNQLLLENPNTTDPYYSLCNFKERQESLAVEKLRGFDEIVKSKALYHRFFGFSSWAKQKTKLECQSEDTQEGDDGITLMYKMLSLKDDRFRRQERAKECLSGWEVCDVQLHDKPEYLKGSLMWKEGPFSTRKTESKLDSLGHSAANQNKKDIIQCKHRKWDFLDPKITKQDMNAQPKDESTRQNTCNSNSLHKSIKFHRFSNTNDYMKYYRENVTHTGIKRHFFNRLEGKADKVRPSTFPLVKRVKSQAKTQSPAKVYRFHITDNASFGILKVGPCPSLKMKKSPRIRDDNEAGKLPEKFIIDIDYKKDFTRNGDTMKANASRRLTDRSSYSLSPKKSHKSRKSYPIPTANTTDFDEVTEVKSDEELNDNDDGIKVLKKVGLKINKAIAPRLRAKKKAPRLNKPKQNQTAVIANRTKQGQSCQRALSFSKPPTNTLGDKEFLRITKPKVIGINPANQKGSSKFDGSLSSDQLQASVALYPWGDEEGGIPKGRLIETNHIINHQLLKSRLPEKGFQVCITPSSYPKSTIGIKMQIKTEDTIDDEAIQL